jgi:O-antigen ligase
MAREPVLAVSTRFGGALGSASLDELAIVLLGALAAILVLAGAGEPGNSVALASGSVLGAVALVLVARRSMELFVLVVLVLRPAVDGLHESEGWTITDPSTVLAAVFIAVSAAWWIGRALRGRRHPRSCVGLALAALVLAACIATLGSDVPGRSVVETARLATAVLMFFVVDRLCEQTGRPDRFLAAVLGAAVIPVAVALFGPLFGLDRFEVKDGIERAISTFTQSNPLGHFLVIVLLILAASVLTRPGRQRLLAGGAAVPVVVALVLTYTRLAWIALVVGIVVMLWVARRRWLLPALAIVLVAVVVLSPDVSRRIDRLTTANSEISGSTSGFAWRLGQWSDVLDLADRNPVTGIGPDGVAAALPNGQPPHNDVLRAFAEMGILGLATYAAVLVALVGTAVAAWRRARGPTATTIALAFAGVVSAFVVTSLAANLLGQVVLLWYVLAPAAAAAWVGRHGAVHPAAPPAAVASQPSADLAPDATLPTARMVAG